LGLNLKERSSGKHQGRLMITKRGSGRARKYLYLAALRLVREDPVVKLWYAAKVRRDGGKKMRALVAIMRKLALALWHVAQGKPFNSSRLFDAARLLKVA
jgi:transposase